MKTTYPAQLPPIPGRRVLLRVWAAAGLAILAACAADPGASTRPALNIKRDLSKENGASKR